VATGIALAFACVTAVAGAHSRPLSYSFWTLHGSDVDVKVQMTATDVSRLDVPVDDDSNRDRAAGLALQRLFEMRVGGTACTSSNAPDPVPAAAPWSMWRWTLHCTGTGARVVSVGFVTLLGDGHRHLLRWDDGTGHPVERIFDASTRRAVFDANTGSSLFDYVALGVEHLLTGPDHVAFVLALLLLATTFRQVAWLVTAFTVAHSLTLALAVLRVVEPDPRPVEALIGFSIALLGAENAWLLSKRGRRIPAVIVGALALLLLSGRGVVSRTALFGLLVFTACHFALLARSREPAGLRVAVAFAFGLIHGFGFAGAMSALDLPLRRLVPALFGFNLGVEIGQLGVVLLCWPLLGLVLSRRPKAHALLTEGLSAAVAGVGVFWFVSRLFALGLGTG
jgi:hypothetical protein